MKDRQPRTLDWYASLEIAAPPPILVRKVRHGHSKIPRNVEISWGKDVSVPITSMTVLGKYMSMTLDGRGVPRNDEKEEMLSEPIACTKHDHDLDCHVVQWNDMYPSNDDVTSIQHDIAVMKETVINDENGILFPDLVTPHASELRKVIATPFSTMKNLLIRRHAKINKGIYVMEGIPWEKAISVLSGMAADRLAFDGLSVKSMRNVDREDMIDRCVQLFTKMQEPTDRKDADVLSAIKLAKATKELLDPIKMREAFDNPVNGFIINRLRHDMDMQLLARERDDLFSRYTEEIAGTRTGYMAGQNLTLAYETAAGMALDRGMCDLVLSNPRFPNTPIEIAESMRTRSVVTERWLDKCRYLRDGILRFDKSGVTGMKTHVNARNAAITMFLRDEGNAREQLFFGTPVPT